MVEGTCVIEGCVKPKNARGWCKGHYYRWGRYGDPLASAPPQPPRTPAPRRACVVEECGDVQYAHGLCEKHYARRRRHGGLHDARATRADVADRFWPRVDKSGDCWLWLGPPNSSGYGSLNVDGRILGAHVVSLMLDGRPVPAGREADHICRNRLCVRPAHLQVVTHAENVDLAWRRTRHAVN